MQVLEEHLSELCTGCMSLGYTSAKGASPWGTSITELCKRCKSLWYTYQRAMQKVQVLEVHLPQSSAKASPCGTSITEFCKGCKSLWYICQSSAKGASPCCTFIKALQRVQVLVVQLSHSCCKGCKSLRYTYQSSAMGASPCLSQSSEKKNSIPWGTPIPELCKEWHAPIRELCKNANPWGTPIRALQRVQVLDVHLSELRKGGKSLRYTYQSSAKDASPWGTPIRAIQRVHVLKLHLPETCAIRQLCNRYTTKVWPWYTSWNLCKRARAHKILALHLHGHAHLGHKMPLKMDQLCTPDGRQLHHKNRNQIHTWWEEKRASKKPTLCRTLEAELGDLGHSWGTTVRLAKGRRHRGTPMLS